mmetsp:Transcript_2788/g.6994  ORF Transcript_2788/g.6994 Transcript_2788/m.6994 type:complete len:276 (+) Transcript_2788:226-1053(+)
MCGRISLWKVTISGWRYCANWPMVTHAASRTTCSPSASPEKTTGSRSASFDANASWQPSAATASRTSAARRWYVAELCAWCWRTSTRGPIVCFDGMCSASACSASAARLCTDISPSMSSSSSSSSSIVNASKRCSRMGATSLLLQISLRWFINATSTTLSAAMRLSRSNPDAAAASSANWRICGSKSCTTGAPASMRSLKMPSAFRRMSSSSAAAEDTPTCRTAGSKGWTSLISDSSIWFCAHAPTALSAARGTRKRPVETSPSARSSTDRMCSK